MQVLICLSLYIIFSCINHLLALASLLLQMMDDFARLASIEKEQKRDHGISID